jgi:hypothetical protein
MFAEDAGLDAESGVAGGGNDEVIEFAGAIGGSSVFEAGAAAFAAVAIEGELRDKEKSAAGIGDSALENAQVHFAVGIREDAEVEELLDHG